MSRADRQLPQGGEIFLDHVGYFAADLGVAGAGLSRLGFQVTPVNVQYNSDAEGRLTPTGTSNRLVKLRRGFIEVLAATGETPLAGQLRGALARHAGFHVIALTHADMAGERARLMAAGFAMQPAIEMRRLVETPEGERQMAYSILRTEPGVMAEGRVQMLTNHTPELLWTPGSTEHDNGADALTDLLLCVADPAEAAARFGRFTARAATPSGDMLALDLDRGRLLFAGPESAAAVLPGFDPPELPYVAGLALGADLEATRRALVAAGARPVHQDESLILLAPVDALGAYLLFHAAQVSRPWEALARRQ
jgi:hypothetical protein